MTWTTVAGAVLDVPVDPDAETARRWLTDELADPVYHDTPSLLERLIGWLMEQLDELQMAVGGTDLRVAAVVVTGIAAAVIVAGLLVAGPMRRARRAARASHDVLGEDLRTAAQLRAAADAAAAAGRFDLAVLDRFRAVLRSLEERVVLDPLPGRTADEAAAAAGDRLPSFAEDLAQAGRLFDDVCYGDVRPDAAADTWLREVDRAVTAARPTAPTSASDLADTEATVG